MKIAIYIEEAIEHSEAELAKLLGAAHRGFQACVVKFEDEPAAEEVARLSPEQVAALPEPLGGDQGDGRFVDADSGVVSPAPIATEVSAEPPVEADPAPDASQ